VLQHIEVFPRRILAFLLLRVPVLAQTTLQVINLSFGTSFFINNGRNALRFEIFDINMFARILSFRVFELESVFDEHEFERSRQIVLDRVHTEDAGKQTFRVVLNMLRVRW